MDNVAWVLTAENVCNHGGMDGRESEEWTRLVVVSTLGGGCVWQGGGVDCSSRNDAEGNEKEGDSVVCPPEWHVGVYSETSMVAWISVCPYFLGPWWGSGWKDVLYGSDNEVCEVVGDRRDAA